MRDRRLLYATAFLRSLGTSLVGVLLGIYLAKLGFGPSQIGSAVAVGLSGAAAAALTATLLGDRVGRRRALLALACAGALGTVLAAASSHLVVLAAAAFVGMLNGMGRDRGAALVLEQAIAGGFLTTSLLSFFFFERFGVAESTVGILFFGARVANAASHLGAAWLARHLGLVNTMVLTHIPSSLLLVTVAFAPTFPTAVVLFLLREGLVEMDVPTRQSYVMAVVRPEERTFATGITNLVRLGGWAIAPAFAGLLMRGNSLGAPLLVGSGMKVAYDLLLFVSFRKRPPPEERLNGSET